MAPLRQWTEAAAAEPLHVFTPADAVRRVYPADLDFHLAAPARSVKVEILDSAGAPVRTVREGGAMDAGLHRLRWDLRYPGATVFDNLILEGGNPAIGPLAPPGRYQVRVTADGRTASATVRGACATRASPTGPTRTCRSSSAWPSASATPPATPTRAVIKIREVRARLEPRLDGLPEGPARTALEDVLRSLGEVEGELYQVKNRSPKDKIA